MTSVSCESWPSQQLMTEVVDSDPGENILSHKKRRPQADDDTFVHVYVKYVCLFRPKSLK